MIKFNFFPVLVFFTILLISCPNPQNKHEEGDFYAQNIETGAYYTVKAELLAEGQKCVIWAEKGNTVEPVLKKKFANSSSNFVPWCLREIF